jgi:hypothetical protein
MEGIRKIEYLSQLGNYYEKQKYKIATHGRCFN